MSNVPDSKIKRNASKPIIEAMRDTPIVAIQGARQVGKSTLAQDVLADRPYAWVSLDDRTTRLAAEADPRSFVEQFPNGCLGIDEVQRVPDLILALKLSVDIDRRPGRFLLTGSANLLRLPAIKESLAGRSESIELFGISQGELRNRQDRFIDRVFSGDDFVGESYSATRNEYMQIICHGTYPEVIQRTESRRQSSWYRNYVQRIIERDAEDLSILQRLSDLPRLLRLLAARNGCELVIADIARDSGIPERTLPPYIELLETMYLIRLIPPWSTNLAKRVSKRPKIAFLDQGLAAYLTNIGSQSLTADRTPQHAGGLVESFVVSELIKQLTWSDEQPIVHHFRNHDGDEIDIMMETRDGRIVAIEVKSSASLTKSTGKALSTLRDRLGERFVQGIVLYTGTSALSFGDRITALPLEALWS